jgi:hypothetical protein
MKTKKPRKTTKTREPWFRDAPLYHNIPYKIAVLLDERDAAARNAIQRVVQVLGEESASEWLIQTLEIERKGGLPIIGGGRRGTPTEVFLSITLEHLKCQDRFDEIAAIFGSKRASRSAINGTNSALELPRPPDRTTSVDVCPFCRSAVERSKVVTHVFYCQSRIQESSSAPGLAAFPTARKPERTRDGYRIDVCSCHRRICLRPYKKAGYDKAYDIDRDGYSSEPHVCEESTFDMVDIAYEGGAWETNPRRH